MDKVIACMHKFLGKDQFGREYVFTNEELELYKLALTHRKSSAHPYHNQRLAFLSDSVLRLIIRDEFYNQHPDWNKDKLSIAVHITAIFATFHIGERYFGLCRRITV